MYTKRLFLTLLFVAAILTACSTRIIRGSGNLITENRQVSNFDRIDLSGVGDVIITQGGSESLSIETDDNIMQYVETVVENGTLKLGFKSGFNMIDPSRLIFQVGVDDLTSLTVSGSGNIEVESLETEGLEATVSGSGNIQITGLSASEVSAEISGSGEINLDGDAPAQNVSISGSGSYQAGDLCSASVRLDVSGSGEATVCAMETLDANISGSGSVNYYGQPAVSFSGSGSGNIQHLGDK